MQFPSKLDKVVICSVIHQKLKLPMYEHEDMDNCTSPPMMIHQENEVPPLTTDCCDDSSKIHGIAKE